MAPDDSQNRCANCIRLKKECNFYPVDQQPPQERRTRTGSKADNKSNGNSSSSSSPGFSAGTSSEYVENFGSFSGTSVATHPYAIGVHPNDSATFSPPSSTGTVELLDVMEERILKLTYRAEAPFATNFDFPNQRHHWDHSNHQYEHSYSQDDHRGRYWPPSETLASPAYPYPSIPSNDPLPLHDIKTSHSMYGGSRAPEGMGPMRSMSYSQVESLAHDNDPYHNHAPIFMQDHHSQQRRTTNASEVMPPPSLRHSASSSMVSINEGTPTTYAGAAVVTLPQSSGVSYSWNSSSMAHPSQSPKTTEFSNANGTSWQYGEPSHLPKVQEEQEGQMQYVAEPAVLYSNVQHQ